MVRVKICGITNVEDAMAAAEAGADALGFVFAESPRRVDVETVRRLVSELPAAVATVGVFADATIDEVLLTMEQAGLHFAQVHGAIGNSGSLPMSRVGWGLIRALRVGCADDIRSAERDELVRQSDAVVLDAQVEGLMGGTGQKFDWDLAGQAASLGKPIILAGGLTPANVGEAIAKVRPYGVDVSSGVEASPGKKDHDKIREFIQNVRECA